MVQLSQIVTVNASAFVLLIIIKIHMNTQIGSKGFLDTRLLRTMINLTMFQCVFDTLVFWVDGQTFPLARELNWFGNVVYYILNGTIAYFWPLFTEYKLSASYEKVKRMAFVYGIPLVLDALLIASAPFNGIVFTVSKENVYSRTGYLFMIPTILIFAYIILGTTNIYINRKKEGKYMLFPAIYFVTPVSLGIIIQSLHYGISLTFIGIAIGLTGVYMSTQNESAYIDHLCGVYNRRYYNDYVRSFCSSGKKGSSLTGVLIDMDNFKQINDNFGHHIGDKALMIFAEVLRKNMNDIGFAVRYGGDEFILVTKQSEETIAIAIENIQKEIDEINTSCKNEFMLGFSYGIASITPDNNSDEFLNTMDGRMYEMKKARKSVI